MPSLHELVAQGGASPLIILLIAFTLGALHGLEPGHSKTMMAAFIIAVRGTVGQAVLLGLSAASSHVLVVWLLAMAGLTWGESLVMEEAEAWLLTLSGVIMILIAAWIGGRRFWGMLRGGRLNVKEPFSRGTHSLASSGTPLHHEHDHDHHHDHHHTLAFTKSATLSKTPLSYHQQPVISGTSGLALSFSAVAPDPEDAHQRAHAKEIRQRFGSGSATTQQILVFGLTGGLIPCPAAVTVLILCLNLGRVEFGVGIVAAFSIGLAVTLVSVGVVAAFGSGWIAKKTSLFSRFAQFAPFISSTLIAGIGVLMLVQGITGG